LITFPPLPHFRYTLFIQFAHPGIHIDTPLQPIPFTPLRCSFHVPLRGPSIILPHSFCFPCHRSYPLARNSLLVHALLVSSRNLKCYVNTICERHLSSGSTFLPVDISRIYSLLCPFDCLLLDRLDSLFIPSPLFQIKPFLEE